MEHTAVGQGGVEQVAVVVEEIQTGLELPGLVVLSAGLIRQENHLGLPVVGQEVVEQDEGDQSDLSEVPAVTQTQSVEVDV